MEKVIFVAVIAIGILVLIDHYLYFDHYTETTMLMLNHIRRSFGW